MLGFFTRKQLNLPPPKPANEIGMKGCPVHVYNEGERSNPELYARYRARKERLLQAIAQEQNKPTRMSARNIEMFNLELLEINRKLA